MYNLFGINIPEDLFLKTPVFLRASILVSWICLLSGTGYGADENSGAVVLFRLTRCCPESAWTEAEYAVLKELDAMDVSVTLLDRDNDSQENLKQEIEAVGIDGKHAALLYFYKDAQKGVSGVRIAIFDASSQTSRTRHIVYTVQPSINAVSIATLKAVEAVREVIFGPPPEIASPSVEPEKPATSESKTSTESPEKTTIPEETPEEKKSVVSADEPLEKSDAPPAAFLPHRFAVGLGPSGWWSPGGAGPAFALQGAFNLRIKGALFAEVNAAATFVTKKIRRKGEGAEYKTILFRAALFWSFLNKGRLHPMAGISGGVAMLRAVGLDGDAPGNRTDTETVGVVSGQARLGVDLASRWGLVFGLDVAIYIPKVKIMLLDEKVADIGRPMLDGFCNLEFRF